MELVIRLGGVDEHVRVERHGTRYRVQIGERRHELDVFVLNALVRSLDIAGAQYDVAIRQLEEGKYAVTWDGHTDVLEVADPLTHLARVSRGGAGAQGRQHVTAYMPGRVVAVQVNEGDTIVAGQPLLVLEAMKMQNEIQAESDGTVRRVAVQPGQAVEGGDLLLEIE